ncbi:MAG: DUF1566 domain-containing protein [Anaerolineaceae bacterium]
MNRKFYTLPVSLLLLLPALTGCFPATMPSKSNPAPETSSLTPSATLALAETADEEALPAEIADPSYASWKTWKFAMVGDTHVWAENTGTFREIVAALLTEDVDLVLFPGDIVQAGLRTSEEELVSQLELWQELAAPLVEKGVDIYPLRGNHEADANNSAAVWPEVLGKKLPQNGPENEIGFTYAFTHQNALFIGLDNYIDIHHANQEWLEDQLAGNKLPVAVVFGHEPAFKAFHSDTLDDDPAARDIFWESLRAAGVKIYFSGHDHFLDLARIDDGDGDQDNDLYQAIIGSGGSTLAMPRYHYNGENSTYSPVNIYHDADRYGYLLVDVREDGSMSLVWKARMQDSQTGEITFQQAAEFLISDSDLPVSSAEGDPPSLSYAIVDTGQGKCYDNQTEIPCAAGGDFIGQDAQYATNTPSYQDNSDGTVTDLVTGLMWQQSPGKKVTFEQAVNGADSLDLGGFSDWRLPTIKELYSLIRFDGGDVSPCMQGGECTALPFIDNRYFDFQYGDTSTGERVIDSQYWSSTQYISTTMNGSATTFGVNFADGRIKGYPSGNGPNGALKTEYALYVRGNPDYGRNAFSDNGDGMVTDSATGLTWMQADSGAGMDWQEALGYCENITLNGQSDWRLPDAKELQSIVDYTRSPLTSGTAAIDPVFQISEIKNEAGQTDYPFFWSSTTHADEDGKGTDAAYVAFGLATGNMGSGWIDVHGAGAQRSDPKAGNAAEFAQGRGPQGDSVRIENYVRCVRGVASLQPSGQAEDKRPDISMEDSGVPQTQPGNHPPNPGAGIQAGSAGSVAGGAPQEAVEACLSKPTGATCQFTGPNGVVTGACQQKLQFVCYPAGLP